MTEKKPKGLTLEQYVAQYPTQDDAAKSLGTTATTISRWLNGHNKPKGMVKRMLIEKGILV